MKKKNWATRMISGLLSAMMVLTTVVTPMTVMASEIIPEDELREYVSSLPELKDVKDQLDPDEIVEAKDYEVDFGTEIDLKNDFTNMEIPNRDKVKVSFFEAKNAAGTDFSANNADTYKAVYYVEPMNEMHPVYRVSRSITVKEPVTEPQVPEEGSDGGDDGQSGEEAEDAEADPVPESEAAMIPEPEAAESYVPDTFEDSEESTVFYEFTEEAFQEEMAAVTETVDETGTAETIMAAESDAAFAEEEMMEEMAADNRIVLITGDLGFGVLQPVWDRYPGRILNAGIAEQGMIGMAAGLASTGRIVLVYSIGNFPTLRPLEQIRNDCA